MHNVLFSILGGAGRREQAYARATYRFDETSVITSTYFAEALLRHLAAANRSLRRLVILGTDRSMWDEAVRVLAPDAPEMEELRGRLFDAALEGGVDHDLLRDVSRLVSQARGFAVEAVLIPYCRSGEDALAIVKMLHDRVRPKDRVLFDITHGLRHLAIIGLFASLVVEALKGATVDEIYYGAFDIKLEDGASPVVRLDGLLDIVRWIRALAVFEASGDLSGMGPLLAGEIGGRDATKLSHSTFLEQTLRLVEARDASRQVLAALGRTHSPVAKLFRPEIERQLGWARHDDLAAGQRELARKHLDGGNYLAAALLGSEAALSWLMTSERSPLGTPYDPRKEEDRHAARREANALFDHRRSALARHYWGLSDLRNALAHAGEPKLAETREALRSPNALGARLAYLLDSFFEA